MKYPLRFASLVAALSLLGGGCFTDKPAQPQEQTPKPAPSPSVSYVGCTPKSAKILEPAPGARVTLPITVKFEVHNAKNPACTWTMFEAQAGTMRLLDKDGVTVGNGFLMAGGDWMTDSPVTFTGIIPALSLVDGEVTLIVTEENPSGEGTPQEISIPLIVHKDVGIEAAVDEQE